MSAARDEAFLWCFLLIFGCFVVLGSSILGVLLFLGSSVLGVLLWLVRGVGLDGSGC